MFDTYPKALKSENGLVRYQYPLNTEKFSILPLEEVRVSVDIRASVPLRAMYSPSHPVDVVREAENHARAGYEAFDVKPDTDFVFYYSLGEEQAFHLLSYRDPSDPADADGFFSCEFVPLVPGKYTVIATFGGSESYWPSHAETAVYVEEAPAATPEPTPMPATAADLYFVPMSIGTIVAIIVVGLLLFLMLRKR